MAARGHFIKCVIFFLVKRSSAQQYGVRGGEITLTSTISGTLGDILWKHNGNKVVDFDGLDTTVYGSYKNRTVLTLHNGELTIKGLTDADSGHYQLEATVDQKLQYSNHEVLVIGDVAQPSVNCDSNDNGTILWCSADRDPQTQFLWRSAAGSETLGSELVLPEDEKQESVYTCVVKNPVSNKTAEFTLKECHTEKGSVLTAVLITLFILSVITGVLLAVWWFRWKGKKCPLRSKPRSDVERAREDSTDSTPLIPDCSSSLPVNQGQQNSKAPQDPKEAGEEHPGSDSDCANQETKSGSQTQEDNQETKSGSQTQEDNQENKSGSKTQEDNQENKSGSQTQEDSQENKSGTQTEEDNQENKSGTQTQDDDQKNQSGSQTPQGPPKPNPTERKQGPPVAPKPNRKKTPQGPPKPS